MTSLSRRRIPCAAGCCGWCWPPSALVSVLQAGTAYRTALRAGRQAMFDEHLQQVARSVHAAACR
jgi:protein-disulfide isomerase-like protein with CxxC motif